MNNNKLKSLYQIGAENELVEKRSNEMKTTRPDASRAGRLAQWGKT